MACTNCKKSKQEVVEEVLETAKTKSETPITDYILKVLLFLVLLLVLTPVIIVVFIIVLFGIVVLSKDINLLPLVYHIGKKIFKEEEDEEEDEDDDMTYDDGPMDDTHELADPDEIIEIK